MSLDMDVDDIINPFELLGLDHKTCTLNDVRKAYRNLAFVCHPDKGGSAQDMRTVQTAYRWITRQLTEVNDRGNETYEEKEQAFKDFLESQIDEKLAPFRDVVYDGLGYSDALFGEIYAEVCADPSEVKRTFAKNWIEGVMSYMYNDAQSEDIRDIIRKELRRYINRVDDISIEFASVQHGYGDVMATNDEAPITSFGKSEMIVYKEPAHNDILNAQVGGVTQVGRMDDYTFGTMCDYRVAFQEVDIESLTPVEDTRATGEELETKLQRLREERQTLTGV